MRNEDWDNAELLEKVGFLTCSQAKLFSFLEDVLHPIRRDHEEQERMTALLNPVFRRDGYCPVPMERVSGCRRLKHDFSVILMASAITGAICQVAMTIVEVRRSAAWWP